MGRGVPQRAPPGPDVPVVLRGARAPARLGGNVAQAAAALGLLHGGSLPRPLHLGPRGRAGAGGNRVAQPRPADGGHRARAHTAADLSIRLAANGAADRHATPHVGVPERHQEQRGRPDHRPGRADRRRAVDPGGQLPGVRGIHGGHPHLHGAQPHRGDGHALAREEAGGARPDRPRAGDAAGRALSVLTGFDWDVIRRTAPYLFREGMTFTLTLTALAMTGGIIFGTLLAMMRLASYRALSAVASAYVNVMRSTPLVLVIFWFYFLVPWIGGWLLGATRPIQVGAFLSSLITFMIFEAAYYCEIMRAGIQSIPRGQMWAGYALGLSYWQTMGQIVLPQAFRNMLPVLLTQTIILFQDTSLVYVLSITDFLGAASKVAQRDGRLVEMYLFAAVVYFAISFGLSSLVKRLQTRLTGPSR